MLFHSLCVRIQAILRAFTVRVEYITDGQEYDLLMHSENPVYMKEIERRSRIYRTQTRI